MSASQNRLTLSLTLFVSLLLAVALAGCGGGGGGSDTNRTLVGHWTGTFVATSPSGQQNGTADILISAAGTVTGTMHNNVSGDTGTLAGTVTFEGNYAGSITYGGIATFPTNGTFTLQANDHLGGQVKTYDQNNTLLSTATVDLIRQ